MEIWAFYSQQSDRPADSQKDNALYQAGYGMHERGTHQGWIRSGSLYVKASEHPLMATVTIAGVALVILFVIKSVMQNSFMV